MSFTELDCPKDLEQQPQLAPLFPMTGCHNIARCFDKLSPNHLKGRARSSRETADMDSLLFPWNPGKTGLQLAPLHFSLSRSGFPKNCECCAHAEN
jgi:hypothetical protein